MHEGEKQARPPKSASVRGPRVGRAPSATITEASAKLIGTNISGCRRACWSAERRAMFGYQKGAVERQAKGLILPRRSLLGLADQGASAANSCSVAGAFEGWSSSDASCISPHDVTRSASGAVLRAANGKNRDRRRRMARQRRDTPRALLRPGHESVWLPRPASSEGGAPSRAPSRRLEVQDRRSQCAPETLRAARSHWLRILLLSSFHRRRACRLKGSRLNRAYRDRLHRYERFRPCSCNWQPVISGKGAAQ
jgi:hypothetical protein